MSFGYIPETTLPATTHAAVPAAVSQALKGRGLAAYPRAALALPASTLRAVQTDAEGLMSKTGLAFSPGQIAAELRSRGYTTAMGQATGLETREAAMAEAKRRAALAKYGGVWGLAGLAAAGVLVMVIAWRYEKKRR